MNYFIETYGCQMNVADSETVSGILKREGFRPVSSIHHADIIIFNTCTVRQHAEDRVIGRLTSELARKRENPNLIFIMIGCVAQRHGDKLLEMIPGLDLVAGVDQYRMLPIMIRMLGNYGVRVNTDFHESENYENMIPVRGGHNNAFVTIMRGCDNFCSYCIVPHVRGRERSRNTQAIINEVIQAGKDGFKDVTLLGQNVNSYNWRDINFPMLLWRLNDVEEIERLRFVTSHPKDLSDELIEAIANCEKVCKHIHLPMQAGNDEVLNRMNRGYTSEHYLNLIKKLKAQVPDIAVTTDIMTGFPGETEEAFEDTLRMMREVEFDFAFMFKYSPREGTPAAEMPDQVDESVRLERLNRMIELQGEITLKKYREQIGREVEVYVEKVSKHSTKEISGKTRDFKIVVFRGDPSQIGTFVKVKIVDAVGWTLKGHLIEENNGQ